MKNYLVDNDPSFILGYKVKGNIIEIMLGNKSTISISYSDENVKYLDDLMEEQHKDYKANSITALDKKSVISSAVVGGALGTTSLISESDNTPNAFVFSLVVGTVAFLISSSLIASARSKDSYNDYIKDEIFLNYRDLLEQNFSKTSFYKSLPNSLRKKVVDIYVGKDHLCLNAINNLSLKDMENLVWKNIEFCDKNKKLVRK